MAEPTQFSFDLMELTTALIKQQGLHEGTWLAGFDFGFGAGMIGPTPDDARPAAFVQVLQFGQTNAAATSSASDRGRCRGEPTTHWSAQVI
jgi:hypothetical protein